MARIVFGMNQTLDGYVDHELFAPEPVLVRHLIERTSQLAGSIYGRRMYEIMRYWEEDQDDWGPLEREFAAAWRRLPKWVVSHAPLEVGPNATRVEGDLGAFVRSLVAESDGEFEVAGPVLAASLTDLGLVDEYRIYLHPLVSGAGNPFFARPRPPLRLVSSDRIGNDVICLVYVPA